MIAIVIETFFTPMFCSASTSYIEGEAPPTGRGRERGRGRGRGRERGRGRGRGVSRLAAYFNA